MVRISWVRRHRQQYDIPSEILRYARQDKRRGKVKEGHGDSAREDPVRRMFNKNCGGEEEEKR
jgi:hypothetical protein